MFSLLVTLLASGSIAGYCTYLAINLEADPPESNAVERA